MKKALFVIQAIALALCLTCLVSITIFQPTVREYFRSTINNDLAKKLKPTVDVAETALKVPLIELIIPKHIIAVAREEVASYRRDPLEYVASLTKSTSPCVDRPPVESEFDSPAKKILLEKIIGWREKVKCHFSTAFERIIPYLCAFLATNILALSFAMYLIRWAPTKMRRTIPVSIILTVVVAFSAFSFLDRSLLYIIIRSSFSLTAYPMGVLGLFLYVVALYFLSDGRRLVNGKKAPEIAPDTILNP